MAIVSVGIDHIATYVPSQYLALADLAQARNVDPNKYLVGLGVAEMGIPLASEDAIVLAANAGHRVLQEAGVSPEDVGLLIVGTESAEDNSKPTATHVHALLGISEACRVYDITHGCAGGTYGLLSAIDWVSNPKKKFALVIASDIARYGVGSPGEPTQGAAAVAMLVCRDPRLMEIEELSTYSSSVYDFWKPLNERYPVVKGAYSIQCYLDAAKACFSAVPIDLHSAFIYHVPYPKMVKKVHAEVVGLLKPGTDWLDHFSDRVEDSLTYPMRVGNAYTASLWLGLVSFLETSVEKGRKKGKTPAESVAPHHSFLLFSYGSGCGAALMRGNLAPSWADRVEMFKVRGALDSRKRLTVQEYEALLEPSVETAPPKPSAAGTFQFEGVKNSERIYSATEDRMKVIAR
jgi:hydroxymethylglutaryl-CoA synthase